MKQTSQEDNSGFIWGSERSGFRHLYVYDAQGNLLRQLTQGEWLVDQLPGWMRQTNGCISLPPKTHRLEHHLYRVSLAGGDMQRITQEAGTHTVVMGITAAVFLRILFIRWIHRPGCRCVLRRTAACWIRSTTGVMRVPEASLQLQPPELVQIHNRQGNLLYGALYRPPQTFGPGPYPTVIFLYGGPGVQMVSNSWILTARLRVQYLRSLGFLVFTLDNRGSSRPRPGI